MGNFWEQFIITSAASFIRVFVKNPVSAAKYQAVLQHIYDDLGVVLQGLAASQPPPAQ